MTPFDVNVLERSLEKSKITPRLTAKNLCFITDISLISQHHQPAELRRWADKRILVVVAMDLMILDILKLIM
jgi:uncharacterized membrane protein